MIVRDESRCLERCLNSVVGLVDEINIVDTGSVDETRDIARSFTDRVVEIQWKADFADARNHAIGMASFDLVVVMDADEWLHEACRPKFRDEVARVRGTDACGDVLILSAFETPGERMPVRHVSRSWIPRVFKMPMRYVGAIHEQPEGAPPSIRLDLTFNHDGYERAQVERKRDRNTTILHDCLASSGRNAYLRFQMGRELLVARDVEGAVRELTAAYEFSTSQAPYRLSVILALGNSLNQAKHYEQALDLLESELDNFRQSPDLFFAIGTTLINIAPEQPDKALSVILPMAIESFLQCLELGRASSNETEIEGVDSYHAARNLAVIYREAYSDIDKANEYEALERALRIASGVA